MEERYRALVELFRKSQKSIVAIGNETRQAIILTLLESPSGGMRVGEIAKRTHLSQPSVSHHLRILCDSKLVEVRKSGAMNFYRMDPDKAEMQNIMAMFQEVFKKMEDCEGKHDTNI